MGAFQSTLGSIGVGIVSSFDSEGFDAIDKGLADIDKQLAVVEKDIESFSNNAGASFAKLGDIGAGLSKAGLGLTAAFTVPLVAIAAASIDAAKDMDSLMRGLTAVAGSSAKAQEQLVRLKEVAKLPGLGLEEAVQGSIRLQAVGVSAIQAEREMKAFGNALATVGKGKADLEAVITQLTQMSTKTKVVAEDLKPVMERVPQVATILKNAYGTIDTEALSKAGLTTQQVINTIITGLEKLPPVTGGIGNAFENLEDSSKNALVAIGNLLVPLIEKITPLIESFVSGVESLAKWFGDLPAPVQAAVGGLVALLAAIGPIVTVVGGALVAFSALEAALLPFELTIGALAVAMGPWVLAIAAVTAALAALGVWVYQNWDPIVAVLTQAWAGLSEAWNYAWTGISGALIGIWNDISTAANTIWQPIAHFFSTIWDSTGSYFVSAWNSISGALSTVWNGIKAMSAAVWNTVTGDLKYFLSIAEKIPGVGKLLNLDDTWKSAQKAADELKNTAAQTKNLGATAQDTGTKIKLASAENDKAMKAAAKHAEAVRDAWDAAHKRYEDQATDAEKTRKWFEDAYKKLDTLNQQLDKSYADLATNFAKAHLAMRAEAQKTIDIIVPLQQRIPPEIQLAVQANKDLEAAYKALGVTSSAELNKHYAAAKAAYDLIRDAGTSSAQDIDAAWVAMETARQAAAKASGEEITQEARDTLRKVSAAIKDGAAPVQTEWQKIVAKLKDIWAQFQHDIAGGLSFAIWDFSNRNQFNDELDKEAGDLQKSLTERGAAWQKYQADAAAGFAKLASDHAASLATMDADYQKSLADRVGEFKTYAADVATNINDIREKHATALADELKDLQDKLDDREQSYSEYADTVKENIDDISKKYADNLKDETDKLADELRDRSQSYDDFVNDANTSIERLRGDTTINIGRETEDTQGNIADKQRDYDRYAEDTADKIAEVRKKNNGTYSKEEQDLEKSLQRKAQDLQTYIADQQRKLQDYTDDQRRRLQREEQDNAASLARKKRDQDEFLADNAKQLDAAQKQYTEGLAHDTGEQLAALDKRRTDLEQFRTDTNVAMEAATQKHAEEQDKEIAKQEEALDSKRTQLDQYNTDAAVKYEADRAAAETKYGEQVTDMQTALNNERDAYAAFVLDITGPDGKLEALKKQHKTIWGDIAENVKGAFTSMGAAVSTFVVEELEKKLFKSLGDLVTDILPGLGKAMDKVFGGIADVAGSVAGGAGSAAGAAGSAAGGAGQAAGAAVGTGVSALVGMISGIATAVFSFIGLFQNAHQETSLNAIEHNTRYSMMYLGERSDGGIMTASLKLVEAIGYVNGSLDDIRTKLTDWVKPMHTDMGTLAGKTVLMQQRFDEISNNTYWDLQASATRNGLLTEIRDNLATRPAAQVTITISGAASPASTADAVKLKLQGTAL